MKEQSDYFENIKDKQVDDFISKIEKRKQLAKEDYQEDSFIDSRYKVFLKYVQSNSKRFVESIYDADCDLSFRLFGVEIKKEDIIQSFGEDIYEKACKEVLKKECSDFSSTYYDFANAKIKLVCLYDREKDSFEPPIDLDYVRKLLQFEDIPFQIDYENNRLLIETITPKLK